MLLVPMLVIISFVYLNIFSKLVSEVSEISSFLIIAFIKFLEIPLNILEIIVGKLLISLLLFEALLGDDRFKCSLKSSKSFNSRKLILLDVGKVYFVCGNISLKFSFLLCVLNYQ